MNSYDGELECEDCLLFHRSRDTIDRLNGRLTEAWEHRSWQEIRAIMRELGRDGPLSDELLGVSRSAGSMANWLEGVKGW